MRSLVTSAVALLVTIAAVHAAPLTIDTFPDGRGRALIDWPRERPIGFDVWLVRDNWRSIAQSWDVRDRTYIANANGTRGTGGRFFVGDRSLAIDEQITPNRLAYTLTNGDAPLDDVTGVLWVAKLPVDAFSGGTVTVGTKTFDLPREPRDPPHMGDETGERLQIRSADGRVQATLTFDRPRVIRVQDARKYDEPAYQVMVVIAEQPTLAPHERQTIGITLDTKIAPQPADATVTVDASKPLNRFDGVGGNFVFVNDDDQIGPFVLKELPPPAWARTGLMLRDWEPTNDNADPRQTDLAALAARDVPGSKLRKRFELDRELFERSKGNLIASIWYPPEWLFAEQQSWRDKPGKIPPERWPELAECTVSYLLHLKQRYGVEPRFVALNEPDWGVYVLQDGQEMRDWIQTLGPALRQAGLSTRVMLGDVADLNRGWTTIQPTLADPEAISFVGALAYHPWAGQNEAWPRWADLAAQHDWPLFATEMGVDGEAWHDGSHATPLYALRHAERYVEQLRDARTRSILEWEWVNDYPLAKQAGDPLELTARGKIVRQIAASVPKDAQVVSTSSDARDLTAAALVGSDGAMTVHLVRREPGVVRVKGLPQGVKQVRVEQVDPLTETQGVSTFDVVDGGVSIEAKPGVLVTLTTTR